MATEKHQAMAWLEGCAEKGHGYMVEEAMKVKKS